MQDEDFDDEVNNLIEWCEDLDFDKYCEGWHTMATSAKPTLPNDDNNVQVFGLGLGDITIGLDPNAPMANSQQLPGSMGMSDMQGGNYLAPQMSTALTQDRQMSNLSHKAENAVKANQDGSAYLGESPH